LDNPGSAEARTDDPLWGYRELCRFLDHDGTGGLSAGEATPSARYFLLDDGTATDQAEGDDDSGDKTSSEILSSQAVTCERRIVLPLGRVHGLRAKNGDEGVGTVPAVAVLVPDVATTDTVRFLPKSVVVR
jgi:hypothetical protein